MENTSGQGYSAVVPPEIKGWNWGAFLATWVWAIGNKVWIGLLAFIPWAVSLAMLWRGWGGASLQFLFYTTSLVSLLLAIILGIKGRRWAWQKRKWQSVEQFRGTQRIWAYYGLAFLLATIAAEAYLFWQLIVLSLLYAIPMQSG